MSVDDEKQKGKLNAQMNDWLTHLLAGWVGKLALMIFLPVTGYAINAMLTSAEKTRSQITELGKSIENLMQQERMSAVRQNEMLRHMIVLEQRVLGYSTLRPQSDNYYAAPDAGSLYLPPPSRPATPEPDPDPKPKPGGDKGALLEPTDRRKGFARLPLLVRSAHQRR